MSKKALLLGGTGLIGSTLAKILHEAGVEIFVVDRAHNRILPDGTQFIEADLLKPGKLAEIIAEIQPFYIVNCINLATITSYDKENGYKTLIGFYLDLYKSINLLAEPVRYLQIGTTGSGGLGFNIPFTHGGDLEDLPIIHKAAFAGITTSMLTLLSRSFPRGKAKISEVKPGLSIFGDAVFDETYEGVKLVLLDGGESGYYTANYMGFTTVSQIAKKIVGVLYDEDMLSKPVSLYDLTANINATIISPAPTDLETKERLLAEMAQCEGEDYIIATGSLGPPAITLELLFAHVLVKGVKIDDEKAFETIFAKDRSVQATLAYIKKMNPELSEYLTAHFTYDHFKRLEKLGNPQISTAWELVCARINSN